VTIVLGVVIFVRHHPGPRGVVLMVAPPKLVASGDVKITHQRRPDQGASRTRRRHPAQHAGRAEDLHPLRLRRQGQLRRLQGHVQRAAARCCPPRKGHISAARPARAAACPARSRSSSDMEIEIEPEVFSVRRSGVQGALQRQRGHLHQGAQARAARRARGALPRRRLHPDRVPAPRRQVQGLRHRRPSTAPTGTSSTSGASSPRSTRPSRAPTRWRTTRREGIIMLNVRIASPPPRYAGPSAPGHHELLHLRPEARRRGHHLGPFGEFFARDTKNEMCFIGGGAGMAPMRSHIFDQFKRLHTDRKVTFWYGARSCARRSTSRTSTRSPRRTTTSVASR
jgi:Na+-transporting NADH:ubiquinone oxidoreductase subunit F